MRFPIGFYRVFLRASLALPFLLAVFSAEVLLYSGKIAECSRRIVVDAGRFRTDIDALTHLIVSPLPKLPGKVVASPVKLQVLIPLEAFVAYLAHKPVRRQQTLRRQSNHLRRRV